VLAVAGYFVGSRLSRPGTLLAAVLGYGLGILVGISRIMVEAHSLSEVVAGCALGGLVAILALSNIRSKPKIVAAPLVFGIALLALLIAVHGDKALSEELITKVALYLSGRNLPHGIDTP
jgi:membrane-associated PAP2 superfamily phosphatase